MNWDPPPKNSKCGKKLKYSTFGGSQFGYFNFFPILVIFKGVPDWDSQLKNHPVNVGAFYLPLTILQPGIPAGPPGG